MCLLLLAAVTAAPAAGSDPESDDAPEDVNDESFSIADCFLALEVIFDCQFLILNRLLIFYFNENNYLP